MGEQPDTFSDVEFGRRIRRRRDDLQMRQQVVAAQIGMAMSQYSLLEQGRRTYIQPVQVARLARVLQTSTDYLLQLTDERGEIPATCSQGAGTQHACDAPLPMHSIPTRDTVSAVYQEMQSISNGK